jgi:DNA-binding NarL/FixJ family response regulator
MRSTRARTRSAPWHRLFIVDDHPITRYGLARLIEDQPDLVVCGEADNAQLALATIATAHPDLVLADLTLPGKSGLEFIKDLHLLYPALPVLILSMYDENLFAERALRAGARGYLMKSEGGDQLLTAIRQVLEGQVFVSLKISTSILDTLAHRPAQPGDPHLGALTDREFEVFQLIGQGYPLQDIGRHLNVSFRTVGIHRMHIRQKLQLHSGPELTKVAVRWAATQQLV